jgi:hypothetical protein
MDAEPEFLFITIKKFYLFFNKRVGCGVFLKEFVMWENATINVGSVNLKKKPDWFFLPLFSREMLMLLIITLHLFESMTAQPWFQRTLKLLKQNGLTFMRLKTIDLMLLQEYPLKSSGKRDRALIVTFENRRHPLLPKAEDVDVFHPEHGGNKYLLSSSYSKGSEGTSFLI